MANVDISAFKAQEPQPISTPVTHLGVLPLLNTQKR